MSSSSVIRRPHVRRYGDHSSVDQEGSRAMKSSRLLPVLGAGFVLIALLGCATGKTSLDSALVQNGDRAVLAMADVVPDGADSVMLVCPYATVDSLSDLSSRGRESFTLRDAQLPGNDDSEFALLRVDSDTVELLRSYPRTPIDLCGGDSTSGDEFTSSDRLFLFSTDGGETWTLKR